jgi:hypothetical protein
LPTSRDGPTEAGHLLATVEKWDGERGLDILDYAFGHITGRSASSRTRKTTRRSSPTF